MPRVPNVFRREGAYWWRRVLTLGPRAGGPITLCISLLTKDAAIARARSAAMTAQSERVRVNLYRRVAEEGLSAGDQRRLLRLEMQRYRDALDQLRADWAIAFAGEASAESHKGLAIYEALWSAFAEDGIHPPCAGPDCCSTSTAVEQPWQLSYSTSGAEPSSAASGGRATKVGAVAKAQDLASRKTSTNCWSAARVP